MLPTFRMPLAVRPLQRPIPKNKDFSLDYINRIANKGFNTKLWPTFRMSLSFKLKHFNANVVLITKLLPTFRIPQIFKLGKSYSVKIWFNNKISSI